MSCWLVPLAFLAGCGASSDVELNMVKGKVTLDGEPLQGAFVTFSPDGGRPSTGSTEVDGTYELKYTYNKKGARTGNHVVFITTERSASSGEDGSPPIPARKEILPAKYNTETELTATVKRGKNEIDFNLTK